MKTLLLLWLSLAVLLPFAAFADNPQMYKWTDAEGVVHYSDQPPTQPMADVQTLDIPVFPPQDPQKIAAEQAVLSAELAALEVQAVQQQQAAVIARQQAQLEAALAALDAAQAQAESEPQQVVYLNSAFIPHRFHLDRDREHEHQHTSPQAAHPALAMLSIPKMPPIPNNP